MPLLYHGKQILIPHLSNSTQFISAIPMTLSPKIYHIIVWEWTVKAYAVDNNANRPITSSPKHKQN